MTPKYKLTQEQRMYFSSVLLLDLIINGNKVFPVLLENDAKMLEPILVHMASKGWLNVSAAGYIPTEDGRKVLVNHRQKMVEFRALYKIFNAVDLGAGEFAYARYFDFDTDEEFIDFINEPQFEDMRVAVCEFKKINPLEVIFLEMVDENRFMLEGMGWEAELATGLIWDEMVDIANTNIHLEDLTEYDEAGEVTATGEEVMKLMLDSGFEVSRELVKQQIQADEETARMMEEEEAEEEIVETVTTTEYVEYVDDPYYDVVYYEPYYDPFFVSACWLMLWY